MVSALDTRGWHLLTLPLSILVAAHNEDAFIAEALRSVFAQDVAEAEIVVVDDGSHDDTAQVVTALMGEAPVGIDVRLLRRSENCGLANARNVALAEARGDVIILLDADDRFEDGAIARLRARLESDADARLVFPRYRWMAQDGTMLAHGSPIPNGTVDASAILRGNPIHSDSGVTLRRSDLLAIGGFDKALAGYVGADAWIRFALSHPPGAMVQEADALVHYRRHGSQITADWTRMRRNWLVLSDKLEKDHTAAIGPIRKQANAANALFCAHLAYKSGDYRDARALLWQALVTDPALLFNSETQVRMLACGASLLPPSLHDRLRERFGPAATDTPPPG